MAPAIGLRQPASYRLGDDVDFRRTLPNSDRDWEMTRANAAIPARRRSQVISVLAAFQTQGDVHCCSSAGACTRCFSRSLFLPVFAGLSRLWGTPELLRCARLL